MTAGESQKTSRLTSMLDIELATSPPSRLTIFVGIVAGLGRPILSDKTGKPAHNPCKTGLEITARLPMGTCDPLYSFGNEPACPVGKVTRRQFRAMGFDPGARKCHTKFRGDVGRLGWGRGRRTELGLLVRVNRALRRVRGKTRVRDARPPAP
jgi:hypothetical protein